jgi:hypothetical protein
MPNRRRVRWVAWAIAVLAAGPLGALPVVDPEPLACDGGRLDKLSHVLPELLEDATPSGSSDGRAGCFQPCTAHGSLVARVTSPALLDKLQRKYPAIKSAQFGDVVVMDLTALSERPRDALTALCDLADDLNDLRFLGGAVASGSAASMAKGGVNDRFLGGAVGYQSTASLAKGGVNDEWRKVINAPPDPPEQSGLTVAIIDGGLRGDHRALPQVDDYEVTDYVLADGTCASGRCCTAIELGNPTVKGGVYEDHPAMTLGTIAAEHGHQTGVSGLSRPHRILSIDPRGRGCGSAWNWATAVACAVELGADVIHYSGEGMPGHAERLLFEAAMARSGDVVLVLPAGNRWIDLDSCPRWPTSFNAKALTVTAFDRAGGTGSAVGHGANTVDLGFPMYSVYTTAAQGANSYNTFNLTSATSAIVTGSLMRMSGHSSFARCGATELAQLLLRFADPPRDRFWRANMSPLGGQLNLSFLHSAVGGAGGNPVSFCP